jgi:hypothetical protein
VAITEENRHHLYQRLDEVLGAENATVLMEHLPPVGWADVATRRDLDLLAERLRVEVLREQRTIIFAMLGTNATLAGLAFAAARLI